jgi:hypothetical protein
MAYRAWRASTPDGRRWFAIRTIAQPPAVGFTKASLRMERLP